MSDAPLPPAPLMRPLSAGALALAAALGQLWGWLNSRRGGPESTMGGGSWFDAGLGTYQVTYTNGTDAYQAFNCMNGSPRTPSGSSVGTSTITLNNCRGVRLNNIGAQKYKYSCAGASQTTQTLQGFWYKDSGGNVNWYWLNNALSGTVVTWEYYSGEIANGVREATVKFNGNILPPPYVPDPLWVPPDLPEPEPLPDQAPLPGAQPAASPADTTPQVAPDAEQVGPGSGVGAAAGAVAAGGGGGAVIPVYVPVVLPAVAPAPQPLPQPEAVVQPEGLVRPPSTSAAPQTPPTVEVTPDGQVGQPGSLPRADLASIAAEVGRVEQKILQLQRRDPPPFGDLTDLLQLILALLQEPYEGGSYEVVAACETAPGSTDPAVAVRGWDSGVGKFESLRVRVDALAAVLADAELFRKRVCRRGQPAGPEVTVSFSRVEN